MKKNIFLGFVSASFVWVGVLVFNVTFAQEGGSFPELDGVDLSDAVVVATVNFYDPVIKSQAGNKFNIGFVIGNGKQVQPGIKYGVQLIQRKETGDLVIDEKIYDEVVSLGTNDEVKKSINYIAPDFLTGEYHIKLIGSTQDGMPLALWLFDKPVQLNGDRQYVHLKNCFISNTDIADKAYVGLEMGMDIMPGEKLLVICEAENYFSKTVSINVQYEFFERTKFSEKDTKKVSGKQMSIAPGVTDRIAFDVPYVTKPQAYDVSIKLFDTAQKEISNDIIAHYVLQGESATIQGIRTDKSEYKTGETAHVSFLITGSAGNFEGARNESAEIIGATLDITLTDGSGNICAQKKVKIPTLNEMENQIAGLNVTRDCYQPLVRLVLKNSQGKILYETQMKVSENKKEVAQKASEEKSSHKNYALILFIILLFISLSAIGIYFFSKRGTNISMVFLLLLFSGMFFFGGAVKNVSADTYVIQNGHVTVVVNWPREQYYSPGTDVNVQAGIPEVLTCGNRIFTTTYVKCDINEPDEPNVTVTSLNCDIDDSYCQDTGEFCRTCHDETLRTRPFRVPDNCIENILYCDAAFWSRRPDGENYWSRTKLDSISLGTPPCVECGPAAGRDHYRLIQTDPTLCNSGEVSNFSELTNSWTWDCVDTGGSVPCLAGFAEIEMDLEANPSAFIGLSWDDLPINETSLLTWTANNVEECTVDVDVADDWLDYDPVINNATKSGIGTDTVSINSAKTWSYQIDCRNRKQTWESRTVEIPVNCTPDLGEWSGCSNICGGGVRYRDVLTDTCEIFEDHPGDCNNQPCGSGWTEK